ncbi:hypothetical protein EZS27_014198 [termite gut metagenome]|uniref:Uncharacterized protein n=1 Tax=termite gut metagenome TaxID=433724 RepID=A0A5J4RX16_9ZZZZ
MDIEYYKQFFPKIVELMEKSLEKQYAFFSTLSLVSATLLAILISLHANSHTGLHTYRMLVLALSLVLLLLCNLTALIVSHALSFLPERTRLKLIDEIEHALKERRKVDMKETSSRISKFSSVCQTLSPIFFFLGLLFLVTYAAMGIFDL